MHAFFVVVSLWYEHTFLSCVTVEHLGSLLLILSSLLVGGGFICENFVFLNPLK